jgi:hypothetical protein
MIADYGAVSKSRVPPLLDHQGLRNAASLRNRLGLPDGNDR